MLQLVCNTVIVTVWENLQHWFFFFKSERRLIIRMKNYSNDLTSGLFSEQLSTVFHFLFSFVLSFSLVFGTSSLWTRWQRRCSSYFYSLLIGRPRRCLLLTASCFCWTVATFHRSVLHLELFTLLLFKLHTFLICPVEWDWRDFCDWQPMTTIVCTSVNYMEELQLFNVDFAVI